MSSKLKPSAVLLSYFFVIASLVLSRGLVVKAALLCFIFILSNRIASKSLFKNIKSVLFFALIIFVVNSFMYGNSDPILSFGIFNLTKEGIYQGGHVAYLIIAITALTSLMLSYLDEKEVADGFIALLSPLARFKLPVSEMAMILTLVFRFISIIKKESLEIINADKIRTAGGSRARRFFLSILIPIFISSFRHADNLALAMEARGYLSIEPKRESIGIKEVCLILFSIALMFVSIIWRI